MKAILRFDLDEPGEAAAHARCCKALDLAMVLSQFAQEMRSLGKYGWPCAETAPKTPTAMLEALRDRFYGIMDEHGIVLDELLE